MQNNQRVLGFWMCTALVVGNIIGMGIFMLPASLAPYGHNAFFGWVITVIGCLFVANVFAHFARQFPNEDGPYGYTRRAFGNGAAFFVMWCYWVSVWITNATLAIAIIGYAGSLLPVLTEQPLLQPLSAFLLLWFFVGVNARGAHTSGRVQMITTVLKLMPMLAVVVLGLFVLFSDPAAYTAHTPTTPVNFDGIAAAGTIALFAMLGVECATVPAGKVENPQHTLPRATLFGTALAAVVYIAVSAVPLMLIPQNELASSNAPFVDLFSRFVGGDSGKILALFVMISGLGALNGWTMIAAEVTVSFSRHEVFPARFSQHNRFGAPLAALLLTGTLASIMVAMNYSRSMAQGFTFLSVIVTAANLPLYLVGSLALIKLLKRGDIKTIGRDGVLILSGAIIAMAFSLWAFYGVGGESALWALALGSLSLPVFWWRKVWSIKGLKK